MKDLFQEVRQAQDHRGVQGGQRGVGGQRADTQPQRADRTALFRTERIRLRTLLHKQGTRKQHRLRL